jgi:hypothetical protein
MDLEQQIEKAPDTIDCRYAIALTLDLHSLCFVASSSVILRRPSATGDVVVLSQACDILNEKIDSIVVCPRWPLSKLIEENRHFLASKARENLRQGKEPSYHLLISLRQM